MKKYIIVVFIILFSFLSGETLEQKIVKKYREYNNIISKHIKLIELKQEFLTGKYFPVTVKSHTYDYIDSIIVDNFILNGNDTITFTYRLKKYRPEVFITPPIYNVYQLNLERYYTFTGHNFEILLADSFSVEEYDKTHYIIKNLSPNSKINDVIISKHNYIPKRMTLIKIFSEGKLYLNIDKYKIYKDYLFIPEKITFSTDSFDYGSLISTSIKVYEK